MLLQKLRTTAACGAVALILAIIPASISGTPQRTAQNMVSSDTIIVTAAQVQNFLGGATGKLVYTKWAKDSFKKGRSLWFIDFSESPLVEHLILTESDGEPRNAIISRDGNWITYNVWDESNTSVPYICPLRSNGGASKIKIDNTGAQPHWWRHPQSGKEYIIYNGLDLENGWQLWWQQKDKTYIIEINGITKQPIGSSSVLLQHYVNSGRSLSGGVMFTSGRATGVYKIDPNAVSNASIQSSTEWFDDPGCNPSISAHTNDAEVMVMINGAADNSDLGYTAADQHRYFLIRRQDGSVYKHIYKDDTDGNSHWDTPEYSTDPNYATVVGGPGDLAAPYDLYLFRISDEQALRVVNGNNCWPHLWVSTSAGSPIKQRPTSFRGGYALHVSRSENRIILAVDGMDRGQLSLYSMNGTLFQRKKYTGKAISFSKPFTGTCIAVFEEAGSTNRLVKNIVLR